MARHQRTKIAVPDVVVGEAFTKLRYDRRISPRKDARIALSVFGLVDEATDLFEVRRAGSGAYRQARDILTQYTDQSFSYVDALVLTIVNDDPGVDQILTVDGRDFSIYRFAHSVEIVVP
jgi:predicted nucleic acid-binding protein